MSERTTLGELAQLPAIVDDLRSRVDMLERLSPAVRTDHYVPMRPDQRRTLFGIAGRLDLNRTERLGIATLALNRAITSSPVRTYNDLSAAEASRVIDAMRAIEWLRAVQS